MSIRFRGFRVMEGRVERVALAHTACVAPDAGDVVRPGDGLFASRAAGARSAAMLVAAAVLALTVTATAARASGNHSRGRALFDLCAQCHGAGGGGNREFLAPAIAGLSQVYLEEQLRKFRNGMRGTHPEDIEGMRMRPMSLTLATEEDVRAVVAYLVSLPPARPAPLLSGGDAEKGKLVFSPCTACHGLDGSGNEQLKAPPLRYASDWYLLSQLKKLKAGIRGFDPADQPAALMRPMTALLPDEQAMRDVIAYIATLAD